jgi:hypothetical protein
MVYIDDDYRFIFIDNPKSGSTAITNALRIAIGKQIPRGSPKEVHLTSQQIRTLFPDKWATYLKVTTWRDPLRRFASAVNYGSHYFNNYSNKDELIEHIKKQTDCVYCLPQEAFTDGCDFLIRLDTIQKDFNEFCKKIGVDSVHVSVDNKKDTVRKFFNLENIFTQACALTSPTSQLALH